MKDQALPMPLGTELLSLRVSFFVPRTKLRVSELRRMIKEFALQPPEGGHWIGASFLGPEDSKLEYFLHIDDYSVKVGDTVPRSLGIETSVRAWPDPKAPASLAARPRFDRIHQEILKLAMNGGHQLGFFDAEVSVPLTAHAPPTNVIAIPLTVGSRTLPVIGIEYGGDPVTGSVDRFRWTRTTRGITVKLSYTREADVTKLPEVWTSERDRIGVYVREALAR